VNDCHIWVQLAYKRLYDSKLKTMATVRATAGPAAADVKKEGMNDMAKFFKHQLF